MRTSVLGLLATVVAAALVGAGHGPSPAGAASTEAAEPVDIELAIDGTGSMAPAIARAKAEGARAVTGVSSLLPDTRFGVVVFRDHGNPAGEYQLLQPLTDDDQRVQDALNRITTQGNASLENGPAESYNLAFHNAYTDSRLGWRPSARKIVVVLGDAEPNGAGAAGVPGCQDRSTDAEGLSTPDELANMRAAKLTLIMIREVSPNVSVSLPCYQSLAAGAFAGGQANDAGADIAAKVVELVDGAFAPATLKNDVGLALRNGRTGYTITVRNPNSLPVTIKSLQFNLPRAGFRYIRSSTGSRSIKATRSGMTLTWPLNAALRPRKGFGLHLLLKVPRRLGTYRTVATARVLTAGGHELVSKAPTQLLQVKRRVQSAAVTLTPLRTRTGPAVRGQVGTRFGRWHGLPAVGRADGSLIVDSRAGRTVLRATRFQLDSLIPTRAHIALRVVASTRRPRCKTGAAARLRLTTLAGVTRELVLTMPRGCGGTIAPRETLAVSAS
jgi:von Willebrand factor type A domain